MNKITLNKIASIDNLELACKRVLKTEDSKRIKRVISVDEGIVRGLLINLEGKKNRSINSYYD